PTYSLTLVSGDVVAAIDFGNAEAGSIGGQKFEDVDGDGLHDAGERGLDGWTIELVDPATGTVIDTRVTASVDRDEDGTIDPETEAGLYSFDGLAPGNYEVREVVGEGYVQTYPSPPTYSLTLVSGDAVAAIDFGNVDYGSIHGQKFEDFNGDGVHDAGETGLDGWTIELVDPATGTVLDTQVTAGVDLDENGTIDPETETGLYTFEGLLPGSYEVREVLQAGWVQTLPNPSPYSIELAYGQDLAGQDFGNWAIPSEIHGQKWHDINGDGVRDVGDVGLNGWTIELVDPSDGSVVGTAVTAGVDLDEDGTIDPETEAGLYSFTGLSRGNYEVREVVQAGWVQAFPLIATGQLSFVQTLRDGQGDVDGLDGVWSVAVSPDGNHVYTASSSDDAVAVFSRDRATGELDFVQIFRDGQGGMDGLNGANSVTVSPDGNHVYTASNDDDAVAVFSRDGATGELNFVQILRDGQGGVDGLGGANSVTVSPDGNHVYAAGISDDAVAVFSRDGATGELSFVQTLRDGQGGVDGLDGVRSVTVSPDGKHVYAAGYSDDAVAVFSRDLVAGPYQVFLGPDEILTGLDFGNYQTAAISGQKFEDLNADGIRDVGEPGLDGWTIELVDPATGAVIDTQVTAAVDLDGSGTIDPETEAGLYSFDGLAPGSYEVREVFQPLWVQAAPAAGVHTVSLLSGQALEGFDFGNYYVPPPRVIFSSIQDGDQFSGSVLTYTVGFDQELDTANFDEADFALLTGDLNGAEQIDTWSYDPDTSTLILEYTDLPDGQYLLTLLSGDGGLENLLGWDLDGETETNTWPIPPSTSGDGAEGGDFLVNFEWDCTAIAFPGAMEAKQPLGSLIYDPMVVGLINQDGDTDSYTIDVDANQAITIVVDPDATLWPTIELLDPGSNSIGIATAFTPGDDAVLQTIATNGPGTYTVTIGG
ncbi:hypothetical protein LCGC14_1765860, partial [marine sediment metagenome]